MNSFTTLTGVAAPVRRHGTVVAALGVSGPTSRLAADLHALVLPDLRRAAAAAAAFGRACSAALTAAAFARAFFASTRVSSAARGIATAEVRPRGGPTPTLRRAAHPKP